MKKILHVLSALDAGGVEKMLYNYHKYINNNQIYFDFIVHSKKVGMIEQYFLDNGSKVYHVIPKKESLIKNYKEIKTIIKNGNYDVIHCHQDYMSFIPLMIAKRYNVPKRIMHAHGCIKDQPLKNRIIKKISSFIGKKSATKLLACSKPAGDWLFGNSKYEILKNAIEIDPFIYNQDFRQEYRKLLNIEDKLVIGYVGRFFPGKNQEFIIDLMPDIILKQPNAVCLFVGDGPLIDEMKQKSKDLNVNNEILFLGARTDVNKLLNAMDIFVFPSKNEGLGIVAIEAQINGLPMVVSNNIPDEAVMCTNVTKLPLDNVNVWVDTIMKYVDVRRQNNIDIVRKNGYDITNEAKKLQKIYCD